MWEELPLSVQRNWYLVVVAVMVLAAVPLVVVPPTSRVVAWLRTGSAPVAETTVIAARAALQRIGSLGGGTALVLAVGLFIADVHFYLAMVGYAAAAVIGAAAPVGGGTRRRAELTPSMPATSPARSWWAGLGLGLVILTLSVCLLVVLTRATSHWAGMIHLEARFGMAPVGERQLAIITAASTVLLLGSVLARIVISRRQSVAGADPHTDAMLRSLCLYRLTWAEMGGQLILLATLLPALQILTLKTSGYEFWVNDQVVTIASVIGWPVLLVGVLACAVAVLVPVWIHPGGRARVGDPAVAGASTRSGS